MADPVAARGSIPAVPHSPFDLTLCGETTRECLPPAGPVVLREGLYDLVKALAVSGVAAGGAALAAMSLWGLRRFATRPDVVEVELGSRPGVTSTAPAVSAAEDREFALVVSRNEAMSVVSGGERAVRPPLPSELVVDTRVVEGRTVVVARVRSEFGEAAARLGQAVGASGEETLQILQNLRTMGLTARHVRGLHDRTSAVVRGTRAETPELVEAVKDRLRAIFISGNPRTVAEVRASVAAERAFERAAARLIGAVGARSGEAAVIYRAVSPYAGQPKEIERLGDALGAVVRDARANTVRSARGEAVERVKAAFRRVLVEQGEAVAQKDFAAPSSAQLIRQIRTRVEAEVGRFRWPGDPPAASPPGGAAAGAELEIARARQEQWGSIKGWMRAAHESGAAARAGIAGVSGEQAAVVAGPAISAVAQATREAAARAAAVGSGPRVSAAVAAISVGGVVGLLVNAVFSVFGGTSLSDAMDQGAFDPLNLDPIDGARICAGDPQRLNSDPRCRELLMQ